MIFKKKNRKRKSLVRSFARAHGIFTLMIFMFYVAFAIFGDFTLLVQDIKSKYTLAATTISVYVEALPNQPVVTISSECLNEQPQVKLIWNETAATDYYDILRDGQLLVSGITTTSYEDTVVTLNEEYVYIVIAHGSLGSVPSLPVSVVIEECSSEPPMADPECQITTLDGLPIDFSTPLKTTNSLPKFSGTTNMPNAKMTLSVLPGPLMQGDFLAGANGFWEYLIYNPLPVGFYIFQFTAMDPINPSRSITKNLALEVVIAEDENDDNEDDGEKDEEEDGDDNACGKGSHIVLCHYPNTPAEGTIIVSSHTVREHLTHGDHCGACQDDAGGVIISDDEDGDSEEDESEDDDSAEILTNTKKETKLIIESEIVNEGKKVHANQDIIAQIKLDWLGISAQPVELVYEIVDKNGQIISSIAVRNSASSNNFRQVIPLPNGLAYGAYILRVKTKVGETNIATQDQFVYSETPLINLGGSIKLTYSELVSGIGWFALICLLLMIMLALILMHEYYLYGRSRRMITEEGLKGEGLISERKEVSL